MPRFRVSDCAHSAINFVLGYPLSGLGHSGGLTGIWSLNIRPGVRAPIEEEIAPAESVDVSHLSNGVTLILADRFAQTEARPAPGCRPRVSCSVSRLPVLRAGIARHLPSLTPRDLHGQARYLHHRPDRRLPRAQGPAALTDWRDRVDYYTRRIEKFHARESNGKSKLNIKVHPEPLVVQKSSDELRGNDANQAFFNSTNAARDALKWPGEGRRLPDRPRPERDQPAKVRRFTSTDRRRQADARGEPLAEDGRHFPARNRAGRGPITTPPKGHGVGLVNAHGWRVPYSGSDCVIYHEGVGHAIGLPHPEPGDDSVMCFAQYHFWINETWVIPSRRRPSAGATAPRRPLPDHSAATTSSPRSRPCKPPSSRSGSAGGPGIRLAENGEARTIKVRIQTDLREDWRTIPNDLKGELPATLSIGAFDKVPGQLPRRCHAGRRPERGDLGIFPGQGRQVEGRGGGGGGGGGGGEGRGGGGRGGKRRMSFASSPNRFKTPPRPLSYDHHRPLRSETEAEPMWDDADDDLEDDEFPDQTTRTKTRRRSPARSAASPSTRTPNAARTADRISREDRPWRRRSGWSRA